MAQRKSRLVKAKTDLSSVCSYINYACKGNVFAVRLLKDSFQKNAALLEDDLYQVDQLLSSNFLQQLSTATVSYKGKILEVIGECIFDTSKYHEHALRPLSNYLIYLGDKSIQAVNYQLETAVTHFRVPEYLKSKTGRAICLAQIYTVNEDDILENCSKSLFKFDGVKTITNIDLSSFIKEESSSIASKNYSGRRALQPRLTLEALSESIEEDGSIQLKVQCILGEEIESSAKFVVNIEPVDGYVPHRRVTLHNGEATFTAYALHLKAGESLRVKVGLSFYSGLAECTVPVVASSAKQETVSQFKSDELLIAELNAASKNIDSIKQSLYQYIDSAVLNRFEAYKESLNKDE